MFNHSETTNIGEGSLLVVLLPEWMTPAPKPYAVDVESLQF